MIFGYNTILLIYLIGSPQTAQIEEIEKRALNSSENQSNHNNVMYRWVLNYDRFALILVNSRTDYQIVYKSYTHQRLEITTTTTIIIRILIPRKLMWDPENLMDSNNRFFLLSRFMIWNKIGFIPYLENSIKLC